MREIGTMWQIGVLTGKPCTFCVQNGSFSAFWRYKNKERVSRGLDVKWHIPSLCLDASRKALDRNASGPFLESDAQAPKQDPIKRDKLKGTNGAKISVIVCR